MEINIYRTKPIKIQTDNIKQITFDDDILISTDDSSFILKTKDESPITVRANVSIYIKSYKKNYDIININDIALVNDLPLNYNDSTALTGDFIKSIDVVDNKLIIIDSNDNTIEKNLSATLDKTDSPEINNITIYTGLKRKLEVSNYNKDILYSTNSDIISITSDGIYIKPIDINTYMEVFDVSIFATEQGKIISDPTYFTVNVINLEKRVADAGYDFVMGRIFTTDNIKPDDIVSYSGLTINLN